MNELWLGTAESLGEISEKKRFFLTKFGSPELAVKAVLKEWSTDKGEDDLDGFEFKNPVGYENVNGVAVISVMSGTVAKTSNFSRMLEIPSYEDIKLRFHEAYADQEIKGVVLNLDTPGGMARGAFSLAEFISSFNQNVKPVVSYTDGMVASAGVLYGTATSGLFADKYASVGSIGVVCAFMEQVDLMTKIGITVKVFRSAPYKAVPSPYEKLTDKGEEVLQGEVDRLHGQFVEQLSNNLSMPPDHIEKRIASGKVWPAPEAASLGLVKGLTTFERLVATMSAVTQNVLEPSRTLHSLPRG